MVDCEWNVVLYVKYMTVHDITSGWSCSWLIIYEQGLWNQPTVLINQSQMARLLNTDLQPNMSDMSVGRLVCACVHIQQTYEEGEGGCDVLVKWRWKKDKRTEGDLLQFIWV